MNNQSARNDVSRAITESTEQLRPLPAEEMQNAWVDVLERRLRQELAQATAGHCMRVSDLPRPVLERLATRLAAQALPTAEVYLVDRVTGPEPWRVAVHKVVERRNAETSVVIALFPPDIQLAAGDSVDISTFRVIPAHDLHRQVETTLAERIPPALRSRAIDILKALTDRGWPLTTTSRLMYLATVVWQKREEPWVLGAALYTVGLIPDYALVDRPDEVRYRLGQRNIPLVQQLQAGEATALERVLRLPLTDDAFRGRLIAFLHRRRPEVVTEWGEAIASDPVWRDLALEYWPLSVESRPAPDTIRIDVEPLKLPRRTDDGIYLLEVSEKVTVAWQTDPPPMDMRDLGLAYFRVEMLNADHVVVWESSLIRNTGGKTARRSRTIKNLAEIASGVHFFRVIALDPNGDPFPDQPLRDPEAQAESKRINETDDVLLIQGTAEADIDPGEFTPVANAFVRGLTEAELLARVAAIAAGKDPDTTRIQQIEWATPVTAQAESAYATIRFDARRQYSVRLSQRLRRLEAETLTHPETGGHYRLRLGNRPVDADPLPIQAPPDMAQARSQLFAALHDLEPFRTVTPVIALADLQALAPLIERYAHIYHTWLETGDGQALHLDVVYADLPEYGDVALVAPTHPLRMLWALQEQHLNHLWMRDAWNHRASARRIADTLRTIFSAHGLPSLLVLGPEEGYVEAGPLPGGWAAYLPPRLRDSRAALAQLRARLGAGAAYESNADFCPQALADKLELFVRQHPYTQTLVINVINPGDAALIVAALVELEQRRVMNPHSLRYVVRLFADRPQREGVGDAFLALADPERPISEAAATLRGHGESFLFPKLSWSRNQLRDFVEAPAQYPAHITLLLDAFPIALRVARVDHTERSSFVYGLVQDAPQRFVGRGRTFTWIRRPAPVACPELPAADGRSRLLANLLSAVGALQANLLAPTAEMAELREFTAVAMLDLTLANQSLLYSAHAASTWVLTLDPHLGLDYFDAPRYDDHPGYLLDFTPEFLASPGRQLLLTTRIDDEVAHLMAPAAAQLHLEAQEGGSHVLLEALRSLSGRLALKLLSSPTQVQGALGMALSRLFLEAYGLLEEAIVIPLDAHPELTTHEDAASGANLRGDLLIVSATPKQRHLEFLLVETKCYAGSGLSDELRRGITAQLQSSEDALRARFDPHMQDPDRVDRGLQCWQLGEVLTFYLDRALRYGLVEPDQANLLRHLFLDLDAGYTLSVRKVGLMFHLAAATTSQDAADHETPIWIIGRESIHRIVADALRHFVERAQVAAEGQAPESTQSTPTVAKDEIWKAIRTTFGGHRARGDDPALSIEFPGLKHEALNRESVAPRASLGTVDTGPANPSDPVRATVIATPPPESAPSAHRIARRDSPSGSHPQDPTPEVAPLTPTEVRYDVLLGESHPTPQYGLLGTVATEPGKRIALDLNGCNTISVFGVQGSGKSYTVGSIIELSTMQLPNLNTLPEPLGAVVFHFSQTQDYPPEFVSMMQPNDDPTQAGALASWRAAPQSLQDILVLTTADTLEARRREFPTATVEPIAFSSAELSVADWRFLMGATGNDALYLKLLNEAMRQARSALTLEAIHAGVRQAPMSDTQRVLAQTRLDFAARFIDDSRSLRSLLRPGRLIVVDLRDEFVEKEQALGLFVTMLNVFSGAGREGGPAGGAGGGRFNKLIVFDEAHKYMDGTLGNQVVEVIREMRHRGVSVVIASQDPIHVPSAIIELSSAVVLHRFNAPSWLRHIQRSLSALSDLTPAMFTGLGPGEAFVWANKATDASIIRRPSKIRMRPRVTKHGGSTHTAVDDRTR